MKKYKKKLNITGDFETGEIRINGILLRPDKSKSIRNHSPGGFSWGYGGSGPAQLALALCIRIYGEDKALSIYQNFKGYHVQNWPQKNIELILRAREPEFYLHPGQVT